jgi:hypothetical protein
LLRNVHWGWVARQEITARGLAFTVTGVAHQEISRLRRLHDIPAGPPSSMQPDESFGFAGSTDRGCGSACSCSLASFCSFPPQLRRPTPPSAFRLPLLPLRTYPAPRSLSFQLHLTPLHFSPSAPSSPHLPIRPAPSAPPNFPRFFSTLLCLVSLLFFHNLKVVRFISTSRFYYNRTYLYTTMNINCISNCKAAH